MGKSSSRKLRQAIYYTLYRMDPQQTHQIFFLQKCKHPQKICFIYNFQIKSVCSDVPRRFFPGRRAPAIAPRDGISCSGEPLTPIWAAHWAVTQVHGTNFVQLKGVRGEYIRHCSQFSDFCFFAQHLFFQCVFLRIHPVQSVVTNPTQLSGRGFPRIFHMSRELGGKYIRFFPPIFVFGHFCRKTNFLVRFLRIHPVQSAINNPTQLSGRGFPRIFHMNRELGGNIYVFPQFSFFGIFAEKLIFQCVF